MSNVSLDIDHRGLANFGFESDDKKKMSDRLLDSMKAETWRGIYSVPQESGRYVERSQLSSEITRKMHISREDNTVPHALVIHGLGGTGKTQLTLKFIEDREQIYSPILWVDARSRNL